jgi:antitoxin (DNA-binding transcriptional repressor) of toxin-antitoxin stability system
MGIHVNIGEAKNRLSEQIAASLRGEEVIVSKAEKPVARILALDEAVSDAKGERTAQRGAQWDAWIGSKAGSMFADAGDLFLEPTFTDNDMNAFLNNPNDPLNR